MEENFDELFEKSNFMVTFPCPEAAARFAHYVSKRGYTPRIEGIMERDGKWNGFVQVTYWKEDSDDNRDIR